ncbi:hypothetical protein R3P38DRAFT_2774468 [Favolaschia claudopus]|uniref:Uncharacterized protein n=1 Tax=Favolaschia claudopus TaxID=2862362 RepID=A0AAW0C279_9AGAR
MHRAPVTGKVVKVRLEVEFASFREPHMRSMRVVEQVVEGRGTTKHMSNVMKRFIWTRCTQLRTSFIHIQVQQNDQSQAAGWHLTEILRENALVRVDSGHFAVCQWNGQTGNDDTSPVRKRLEAEAVVIWTPARMTQKKSDCRQLVYGVRPVLVNQLFGKENNWTAKGTELSIISSLGRRGANTEEGKPRSKRVPFVPFELPECLVRAVEILVEDLGPKLRLRGFQLVLKAKHRKQKKKSVNLKRRKGTTRANVYRSSQQWKSGEPPNSGHFALCKWNGQTGNDDTSAVRKWLEAEAVGFWTLARMTEKNFDRRELVYGVHSVLVNQLPGKETEYSGAGFYVRGCEVFQIRTALEDVQKALIRYRYLQSGETWGENGGRKDKVHNVSLSRDGIVMTVSEDRRGCLLSHLSCRRDHEGANMMSTRTAHLTMWKVLDTKGSRSCFFEQETPLFFATSTTSNFVACARTSGPSYMERARRRVGNVLADIGRQLGSVERRGPCVVRGLKHDERPEYRQVVHNLFEFEADVLQAFTQKLVLVDIFLRYNGRKVKINIRPIVSLGTSARLLTLNSACCLRGNSQAVNFDFLVNVVFLDIFFESVVGASITRSVASRKLTMFKSMRRLSNHSQVVNVAFRSNPDLTEFGLVVEISVIFGEVVTEQWSVVGSQ